MTILSGADSSSSQNTITETICAELGREPPTTIFWNSFMTQKQLWRNEWPATNHSGALQVTSWTVSSKRHRSWGISTTNHTRTNWKRLVAFPFLGLLFWSNPQATYLLLLLLFISMLIIHAGIQFGRNITSRFYGWVSTELHLCVQPNTMLLDGMQSCSR